MSSTEVKNMNTADFADLDKMLAHMAEETPPVPEDFHDNWLRAVREEGLALLPQRKHQPVLRDAAQPG